jgi:hypothetical protein
MPSGGLFWKTSFQCVWQPLPWFFTGIRFERQKTMPIVGVGAVLDVGSVQKQWMIWSIMLRSTESYSNGCPASQRNPMNAGSGCTITLDEMAAT